MTFRASCRSKSGKKSCSKTGDKQRRLLEMRNLICLGRTRTQINTDGSSDALPVTAITPLPSSENVVFVAQGPTAANSEIQISQVEVHSLPSLGTDFSDWSYHASYLVANYSTYLRDAQHNHRSPIPEQ